MALRRSADEHFMRNGARPRPRGCSALTSPNPAVGCVIVRGERIVGTRRDRAGRPPACGDRSRSPSAGGARARRDRLCFIRALCASGTDAALRPRADRGGSKPRGRTVVSIPIRRCAGAESRCSGGRGIASRRSACSKTNAAAQRGLHRARDARPAVRDAEARGVARRPDRRGQRRLQMDQFGGVTRAGPSMAAREPTP